MYNSLSGEHYSHAFVWACGYDLFPSPFSLQDLPGSDLRAVLIRDDLYRRELLLQDFDFLPHCAFEMLGGSILVIRSARAFETYCREVATRVLGAVLNQSRWPMRSLELVCAARRLNLDQPFLRALHNHLAVGYTFSNKTSDEAAFFNGLLAESHRG